MRTVATLLAVAIFAPAAGAQCTITWVNPASGLWTTASNWVPARIPEPADAVCITVGGEYTVELRGAAIVTDLMVGEDVAPTTPGPRLEVSDQAGQLTVTGAADIRQSGRLFIAYFSSTSFGVLDGAGDVSVDGLLEWEGEITGTGAFEVPGTAVLAVSPRLRGRALRTAGEVTVADNTSLSLLENATFENAGTMTWAEVGGGERGVQEPGSSVPGTFVNAGTVRQAGDNRLAFDVPVVNTGTFEVLSGEVAFRKDSDHAGAAFVVADGARLEFSNQNIVGVFPQHTVDAASTADIAGTVAALKASTLDLAADWTVAGTVELEPAGPATWTGSGDVTTEGFLWGGGTTLSGPSDFRVTGDNPFPGAGTRGGLLDGRTLRVEGTLELFAPTVPISLQNGAVVEVATGGELALFSSIVSAGPGGGRLDNRGTFLAYNEVRLGVPAVSSGEIRLIAESAFGAVLWADAGLDCDGGSVMLGGEVVRVSGSVGTFDGCAVAGPGRLVGQDGGTLRAVGAGLAVTGGADISTAAAADVLAGTGPVTLTDGSLTSDGTLAPGASPGVFSVVGDLTQQAGRVEIELGGLTPGTLHDQVTTTGTFTADGTLAVSLVDGFAPAVGDRFTIALCGACTGAFDTVEPPIGVTLDVQASATEITLVVTGATAGEEAPVALDVLSAPAPNPTAGPARVEVAVSAPGPVVIAVFDALGREVARLHDGPLAAGVAHPFAVDTGGWGSGVYLVRILGPTITATRALTVVR